MSVDHVIYYWTGGRAAGEWRIAHPAIWPERISPDQLYQSLREMGYVAHHGSARIGPPEGPPSEEDFRSVGV
jgi:hypothetical protein